VIRDFNEEEDLFEISRSLDLLRDYYRTREELKVLNSRIEKGN